MVLKVFGFWASVVLFTKLSTSSTTVYIPLVFIYLV